MGKHMLEINRKKWPQSKVAGKTCAGIHALALLLCIGGVSAAPIQYTLTFDGRGGGSAGTGSFVRDDVTGLISGFTWDFGGGLAGGISDSVLANNFWSDFLANNILFNSFADPVTRGFHRTFLPTELLGPLGADGAALCWGLSNSLICGMPDSGIPSAAYNLLHRPATGGPVTAYSGYLTAAQANPVPEPGSLALMGLGLLGLAIHRKRAA